MRIQGPQVDNSTQEDPGSKEVNILHPGVPGYQVIVKNNQDSMEVVLGGEGEFGCWSYFGMFSFITSSPAQYIYASKFDLNLLILQTLRPALFQVSLEKRRGFAV